MLLLYLSLDLQSSINLCAPGAIVEAISSGVGDNTSGGVGLGDGDVARPVSISQRVPSDGEVVNNSGACKCHTQELSSAATLLSKLHVSFPIDCKVISYTGYSQPAVAAIFACPALDMPIQSARQLPQVHQRENPLSKQESLGCSPPALRSATACANLALISASLLGLLAMLEMTPILLPCAKRRLGFSNAAAAAACMHMTVLSGTQAKGKPRDTWQSTEQQ